MHWRERLAGNLASESVAYGYTLSIWGAGALLINQYSTPTVVEIFSYIGGGLFGFGVLALLSFGHLFTRRDPGRTSQLIVASTIHLLATGGNLLIAYLLVVAIRTYTSLPEVAGFLLLGFQVTVAYNLLLLGETFVMRLVPAVDEGTAR